MPVARPIGRRLGSGLAFGLAALALLLVAPASSDAIVSNVKTIDGPSADLTGDVDAAMAEDGTGGVAYLRRVDGHTHVFAAAFDNGVWSDPQRVDVGQKFDSSWPRIAAGNNGRLLVTWTQDFGISFDRLFSATMDPGGAGFRDPVPIDFNIGKATATYPDLAMSRGGTAYVVYNVVTDVSPNNPPGYEGVDVRLQRYQNRLWTPVGSRVDRNSSIPMPKPTAAIAPRVGTDASGNAVVAWVEPDDDFVDRVWARRVFGLTTGIPLQVSPSNFPEEVNDKPGPPLRGNVNAFSLDVSEFGNAAVAFRQQPGTSGPLTNTRLMVNNLPDQFSEGASNFAGAYVADAGPRLGLGVPSVAVDPIGIYTTAFGNGGETSLTNGDEYGIYGTEQLDDGVSQIDGAPQVDTAESGAGVVAWRELRSDSGYLAVQERRADGVNTTQHLYADGGGPVGPPALGGSGLGDAIVAFSQGVGSTRQIAAVVVDAPPDPFLVLVPQGWNHQKNVPIQWDPAPHAVGGVTYEVTVDDEPVLDGLTGTSAELSPRKLPDGSHRIQIYASDSAGQVTGSLVGRVNIDRVPPKIDIATKGKNKVTVTVTDGGKAEGSGVRTASASFGDDREELKAGKGSDQKAHHRFRSPGKYTVAVVARDRAGNTTTKRKKVIVR